MRYLKSGHTLCRNCHFRLIHAKSAVGAFTCCLSMHIAFQLIKEDEDKAQQMKQRDYGQECP